MSFINKLNVTHWYKRNQTHQGNSNSDSHLVSSHYFIVDYFPITACPQMFRFSLNSQFNLPQRALASKYGSVNVFLFL